MADINPKTWPGVTLGTLLIDHLEPWVHLVTSPCIHVLSTSQGAGWLWGLVGHQVSPVHSAAVCTLAGCCRLTELRQIRRCFLPVALGPSWYPSESNLKPAASLCAESKAFYLPVQSQMPCPTHFDDLVLLSVLIERCLVGLGQEKEHQRRWCEWIALPTVACSTNVAYCEKTQTLARGHYEMGRKKIKVVLGLGWRLWVEDVVRST